MRVFKPTYISTAATTVAKSGTGVLGTIVLTETTTGTITVYDNTAASGTIIAAFKASVVEGTYEFNCAFSIGCTVVTTGASKLTVNTQ